MVLSRNLLGTFHFGVCLLRRRVRLTEKNNRFFYVHVFFLFVPFSAPPRFACLRYGVPRCGATSVKELTDEAFARIGDVSFPVDKVVDCLR